MKNWLKVFSFTFIQNTRTKGFIGSTIGIAMLLFVGLGAMNIIFAVSDDSEVNKEQVEEDLQTVYVANDTEIPVDFSALSTQVENYKSVKFETLDVNEVEDKRKSFSEESKDVVVLIQRKEGYEITLYCVKGNISKNVLKDLGSTMTLIFENFKLVTAGLTEEQLIDATSQVIYETAEQGKDARDIGRMLFEMLGPMIVYLALYMMLLMYGQSIPKLVVAEKVSKLMELLLMSVQPYAIIAGKIFAVITTAVVQFVVWIVSGIVGFIIGDVIATNINSSYENVLLKIIEAIKESSGGFKLGPVIVAILVLFIGFAFYCVFDGMLSSTVSKPEGLASITSMIQLPVIASFLLVYMLPMIGVGSLSKVLRYIPFTAAFQLPADILLGNVNILEAIIPIIILIAATIGTLHVTGKLYKKTIF